MESLKQVLDEFDTNLELLKIAYKVYRRELNRDTTIYSCKSKGKNTRRQTKDEHGDLFAKVQNHHHVIPMSPLRRLELPIKSQLQGVPFSTTFLTLIALASFLAEAKQAFINFLMAHYNLGSSRAMSSHLGGFTSKSNKCHKDCFTKLSAEVLTKRISLNPNLDFSQITQTSQRGVGESSQRLEIEYAS
jgi:hypothetical protein